MSVLSPVSTPVNPLPNAKQPNVAGASFYSSLTLAAGSTTVVAPASNVNGVIVRLASFDNSVALYAGTAAPTSNTSNAPVATNLRGPNGSPLMPHDVFVPAGQGLYLYNPPGGANAQMSYDIL